MFSIIYHVYHLSLSEYHSHKSIDIVKVIAPLMLPMHKFDKFLLCKFESVVIVETKLTRSRHLQYQWLDVKHPGVTTVYLISINCNGIIKFHIHVTPFA